MPAYLWLGQLLLVVAALVFAGLLGFVRRVDAASRAGNAAARSSTWWLGYVHDLANVVGLGSFTLGFVFLDFSPSLALLAGFGLALVCYGIDWFVACSLALNRADVIVAAALAALAAVAGILHRDLGRAFETFRVELFRSGG